MVLVAPFNPSRYRWQSAVVTLAVEAEDAADAAEDAADAADEAGATDAQAGGNADPAAP